MRKILIFSLFAALFLCVSPAFAQKQPVDGWGMSKEKRDTIHCLPIHNIPHEKLAFAAGESLKYVMHYKWLGIRTDVGEATVVLSDGGKHKGRNTLYSKVSGRSYRFWDTFFKVRELFESKFYSDNIRPIYFHRDTQEGKYTMKNVYHWNDLTNEITARVERCSDPPIDTVLAGQSCTFDLPSLFYFSRNIDFDAIEKGTNHPISFAIDEEVFNVYFRFIGREVKKIYSLGTFKTMKFAAKVVAGEVFNGEHEMYIWVTDDSNRVPLLFESEIRVGVVSGRLVEYHNLKFPLTCKVTK